MKRVFTILTCALLLTINAIGQIGFNEVDIEGWVGNGSNEIMFVVDFDSDPIGADSAFAWGVKFSTDSINGTDILSLIAEEYENFTYDIGGIFLNNINYTTNNQMYTNPNAGWFSILESTDGENWVWNTGIMDNVGNGQWLGIVVMNTVSYEAEINVPLIPSGINNTLDQLVNMFPNPATDYVQVELPFQAEIELVDQTGKTLQRSFTNTKKFDISHLPSGLYVVKVTEGNSTVAKKLIFK